MDATNTSDSTQTPQQLSSTALDIHQKEIIRLSIIEKARSLLGVLYLFGAEWTDYSKRPEYLDCSEFVEGCYRSNGIKMPDGSQNQFDFTVPTGKPLYADLAFFGKGGKPSEIYHVGMILDDSHIIECRAFQENTSFDTGKVIIRPIQSWQNYPNFVGFRAHPKLA